MDSILASAVAVHVNDVLQALHAGVAAAVNAPGRAYRVLPELRDRDAAPALVFPIAGDGALHVTVDGRTGALSAALVGTPPTAGLARTSPGARTHTRFRAYC